VLITALFAVCIAVVVFLPYVKKMLWFDVCRVRYFLRSTPMGYKTVWERNFTSVYLRCCFAVPLFHPKFPWFHLLFQWTDYL
jgi:membrane-associated protease RseP (regulator of RpoE activity)